MYTPVSYTHLTLPTLATPVDYKIDPTHTATVFSWNHFGFSTPSANFTDIQGVIKVDNAKPANSSVEVTIPLSSVNTCLLYTSDAADE